MDKKRLVIRGVAWSVWETGAGSWKGWARFLDRRVVIHRARKADLMDAVEAQTGLWVGGGSVEQWGGVEAWGEWCACRAIADRVGVSVISMCRAWESSHPAGLVGMGLDEAVGLWLERKEGLARPWWEQHRATLRKLSEGLPGRQVGQVGPGDVRGVLSGCVGKTWGHKVGILRAFFAWCRSQRWTAIDPLEGLESPGRVGAVEEVAVISPGQLGEVWALVSGLDRQYLGLAAWSGLRQAEILRLTAGEVRGGHLVVTAANAKTRQRRLVPVVPCLRRLVGRLEPWEVGWKPLAVWGALKTVLGDGWPRNVLRHSQISYRLASMAGDVNTVAMESGNSPEIIFRHYRGVRTLDGKLVTAGLAKAWFKSPSA